MKKIKNFQQDIKVNQRLFEIRCMNNYTIETLPNYPDNGKHLECYIDLPFNIRKGEDGYHWKDKKGNEHTYNLNKSGKVDERWIVHLSRFCNTSLEEIFEIKVNKDLDKILSYCLRIYKKSLTMELKRIKNL
jgi:hypothetical protein